MVISGGSFMLDQHNKQLKIIKTEQYVASSKLNADVHLVFLERMFPGTEAGFGVCFA